MEQIPTYNNSEPNTLEAFRNRPCVRVKDDPEFIPPTPQEIKILRNLMGLSQRGMARFLGVKSTKDKGSPTIRKWETKEGSSEHRPMNYSAWRLMLIGAGVINSDMVMLEINEYRR